MKFGFNWPSGSSEEKMFKECGRQTTDARQTMETYLSYKLTNEPSAQVS